jgi:hypothetical protein
MPVIGIARFVNLGTNNETQGLCKKFWTKPDSQSLLPNSRIHSRYSEYVFVSMTITCVVTSLPDFDKAFLS